MKNRNMPANILLSICLLCCLSLCQAEARNSSRKANDEVLLGTHTGIYHYLPQDNSIARLLPELKNEVISSIVYDPRKRVYWMGSFIESFTADDLAEKLFISRSSLYLKMNSISGEPPANFIRRIRFNKACKLLLEGRYSISEISNKIGFSSPSYFSTSFKKYVGCLPSEYVKNQGKNMEQ